MFCDLMYDNSSVVDFDSSLNRNEMNKLKIKNAKKKDNHECVVSIQ